VSYAGGTANLTDAGRNWIWISQAGAITVVFNSLTPPAGAQALLGSALTAGGSISSTDTSGVLYLKGGMLKRYSADTTTPADTPPAQLQFWHFGDGAFWYWNGDAYIEFSILSTPVAVNEGGTGATTAAGARANLEAARAGQYAATVNGNQSIAAADVTYSQWEFNQGSIAAPWTLTIPAAASLTSAGVVTGHAFVIHNDTNYAVRVIHTGGAADRYLPEASSGHFYFDGTNIVEVAQNYPQFASLVGDVTFTHAGEQHKALIDLEADGAPRTLSFVSNTGPQRGRLVAVRSNEDSGNVLTAKTAGAATQHDTVFLAGETQLLVFKGDGASVVAPTRPYTRIATANFSSDAAKTLVSSEYTAVILHLTDTGVVLTTGQNVILPTVSHKLWLCANLTAQTLTFKTAAGAGVAVAAGTTALVYGDGTDIRRATADA
jgi:hypothetical protein